MARFAHGACFGSIVAVLAALPASAQAQAPAAYTPDRIPASVAPLSPTQAAARLRGQAIPGLAGIRAVPGNGAPGLQLQIRTPSVGDMGTAIDPWWQAEFISGAFADLTAGPSAVRTGQAVSFVQVRLLLPAGGAVAPLSTVDAGFVAARQAFDAARPDPAADVSGVAERLGFGVRSIQVLTAYGPVIRAVLVTDDLSASGPLSRLNDLIEQAFAGPPGSGILARYEAYAVLAVTSRGRPLVNVGASFRTGAGGVWFDSALREVVPIGVGVPGPPAPEANRPVLRGLRWNGSGASRHLVVTARAARGGPVIVTLRRHRHVIRAAARPGPNGWARAVLPPDTAWAASPGPTRLTVTTTAAGRRVAGAETWTAFTPDRIRPLTP